MKFLNSLALVFAIVFSIPANAQEPRTIRYDGRLEDNRRAADGVYNIGFALFDAAEGGNQLWPTGNAFVAVPVSVSNGQFLVDIGGQGFSEALGWQVFSSPRVFVQTWVNGTILNGRRAIGAVPFAVRSDNGVPPGTIVAFGGSVLPNGWLWCDGASYPINGQYSLLATALGSSWGRNTTSFNVPDLRGRFLRAVNDMGGPAGVAGNDGTRDVDARAMGTYQGDGFGSHQHSVGDHAHYLQVGGSTTTPGGHEHNYQGNEGARVQCGTDNGTCYDFNSDQMGTYGGGGHGHDVVVSGNTAPAGAGATTVAGVAETRPKNVAVKYIIKY